MLLYNKRALTNNCKIYACTIVGNKTNVLIYIRTFINNIYIYIYIYVHTHTHTAHTTHTHSHTHTHTHTHIHT